MRTPCQFKRAIFINLCCLLAELSPGNIARAACTDLGVVIRAGAEKSEAIQIESAALDEASAKLDSARAGLMPSVALAGTATRKDGSSNSSGNSSVASGTSSEELQTGSKIVLLQPLYKGGREYALLRAANAQVEAGQAKAAAARFKAARDVTNMYFSTLGAQAEVAALTDLRSLSERRYSEIKSRVAIGRSRAADGMGAEAQVSNARAQLDAAKIQFDSMRRSMQSATGLNVDSVCDTPAGGLPLAARESARLR